MILYAVIQTLIGKKIGNQLNMPSECVSGCIPENDKLNEILYPPYKGSIAIEPSFYKHMGISL